MSNPKWKNNWKKIKSYRPDSRTHSQESQIILNNFEFDLFVDCGPGFVGSEAWSINDALGEKCEIIGMEPQKERFDLLIKNGYPGNLTNCCVSDIAGEIEGYTGHEEGKSDFWLNINQELIDARAYKKKTIKSLTIDSLLEGRSGRVFVWADIEGSEFAMLKGAKHSLEKEIIVGFFLELHKEHSPDFVKGQGAPTEIKSYLVDYGFGCKRVADKGTHCDWLFTLK